MAKFRKKPVVIEAMQFNGLNDWLDIVLWMKYSGDTAALENKVEYSHPNMLIPTLEGIMTANPTDWIIKGIKGEFYPCKNDIFESTYEKCE